MAGIKGELQPICRDCRTLIIESDKGNHKYYCSSCETKAVNEGYYFKLGDKTNDTIEQIFSETEYGDFFPIIN